MAIRLSKSSSPFMFMAPDNSDSIKYLRESSARGLIVPASFSTFIVLL